MASYSEPFDPAQVKQAQAGDDQARAALLKSIQPILRGYFIKRIGRAAEVDDLIQNTLVRVHEGLKDLEKPGSLKAFAMKAALFELQDYYRGRYDMKEQLYDPEMPPEQRTPDTSSGANIDAERALAALNEESRRIMELRAYGYRYREIAQMVDTTEAAVKMRVKRAFEAMREALKAWLALVLPALLGL